MPAPGKDSPGYTSCAASGDSSRKGECGSRSSASLSATAKSERYVCTDVSVASLARFQGRWGRILNDTSHAATSSLCCASVLRPLHRLLRAPRRAFHQGRQRLGPWPWHVLGNRETMVRREKEGLRLHGTLPGSRELTQVVDVWTSRSRALAVAAGLASSAFVPK
jgi:hypothetical protein